MAYISKDLANEIKTKFEKAHLDRGLGLSVVFSCQGRTLKEIAQNARINSFRIENPNLEVPFSTPRNHHKKLIKEGIRNLTDAFDWGCKNFYPNKFTEEFIRKIAGKITPELYKEEIAVYSETGTSILGASTTPPYPTKLTEQEIPFFIKSLKKRLGFRDITTKIEAAIYAHFNLVRIHPFVDGNGRTARMLQDIILNAYHVPLPIIESGERKTYSQLLDQAVFDYKHNKDKFKDEATDGEEMFYDFMAGKINVSLDKLSRCFNR